MVKHDEMIETVEVLKALADKTRLDLVQRLARKKDCVSCSAISESSLLSQPTMSHHFAKLVEAGVLIETKRGVEKFYELDNQQLKKHGIDIHTLVKTRRFL